MNTESFDRVIDKAAEICGGQNALARKLDVDQSAMAKYRAGKRSVPDHVIAKIAEVAGMKSADVWLIAQEARNPFRREERREPAGPRGGGGGGSAGINS